MKRQTMSNWLIWTSEHLLSPVCDHLHKELLIRAVLHADVTTLQVLHELGKAAQSKSYMWLYRTSGDMDRPIVLYGVPVGPEIGAFQGVSGWISGIPAHGWILRIMPESITVVGCWTHAKKEFDETMKSLPKGKAKNSSAAQGFAYCRLLFKIEKGLADLSPKERYDQRLKQAKPVLDALLVWANTRAAEPLYTSRISGPIAQLPDCLVAPMWGAD